MWFFRKYLVLFLLFSAPMTAMAEPCGDFGESRPLSIPVNYASGPGERELYAESHALILAASAYEHWDKLGSVPAETQDLVDALVGQGFHVRVICDPRGGENGGLGEVAGFLRAFGKDDARLIIFMTGHGWVEPRQTIGYYAGVDSPQAGQDATALSLSSERIIALARSASPLHLLFVVDACYSAAIFTTKGGDRPLRAISLIDYEALAKPTRSFITAGSTDQETPSPSIFTPAFVMGVSGFADLNGDGLVRGAELSAWLRDKVANSTGRATTPISGHVPLTRGEIVSGGGDIVFKYDPAQRPTVPDRLRSPGAAWVQAPAAAIETPPEAAWPDARYEVTYFQKASDGDRVIAALDTAGTPYATTKPILAGSQRVTNGLACHPDAPVEVVRAAARALIEGGVPLKIIDQATLHLQARRFMLQALSFGRVESADYRPLTLQDLDRLEGCPNEFVFRSTS